jgi:hypothetical protein
LDPINLLMPDLFPYPGILQRTDIGSSSSEPIRSHWAYCVFSILHLLSISLIIFKATERSWGRKFEGSAVDLLLETISTYLTKEPVGYAHCSTIVNSSGTGKSRTVDELSKRVITVPICLRMEGTGGSVLHSDSHFTTLIPYNVAGFPPSDSALCEWLLSKPWERTAIMTRFYGFVSSLLTVTRERLQELLNSELSHGHS